MKLNLCLKFINAVTLKNKKIRANPKINQRRISKVVLNLKKERKRKEMSQNSRIHQNQVVLQEKEAVVMNKNILMKIAIKFSKDCR